jgi:hypothetical protein
MKQFVTLAVILAVFVVPALAQNVAPCSWLSSDQVAGALGPGATGRETKPRTESKNGVTGTFRGCTWVIRASGGQFGKALTLNWAHLDSTTGPSTKDLMDQAIQEAQTEMGSREKKPVLTPLTGLGDEAFTATVKDAPFPNGAVFIRKGNSVLAVGVVNVPNALELAQALARSALPKLP